MMQAIEAGVSDYLIKPFTADTCARNSSNTGIDSGEWRVESGALGVGRWALGVGRWALGVI